MARINVELARQVIAIDDMLRAARLELHPGTHVEFDTTYDSKSPVRIRLRDIESKQSLGEWYGTCRELRFALTLLKPHPQED